jgi:hypothetical protein
LSFLTHSREVPTFFASASRPNTRSDRTRPPAFSLLDPRQEWLRTCPQGMVPAVLRPAAQPKKKDPKAPSSHSAHEPKNAALRSLDFLNRRATGLAGCG